MDWDGIADAGVGSLRAEAGRDPYDAELTNLIGELSMRSEEFRIRWATHDRAPLQKRKAAVPTSTRG